MFFSYDRSVEKRIVGARMLSKLKIKKIMMQLIVARIVVNVLSDLVRVILGRWFGHDDLVMMEELHQARSCVIRCLGLFVIFVVVVWDEVWSRY